MKKQPPVYVRTTGRIDPETKEIVWSERSDCNVCGRQLAEGDHRGTEFCSPTCRDYNDKMWCGDYTKEEWREGLNAVIAEYTRVEADAKGAQNADRC